MGWKEGTAASRKGHGLVEPWLPASRPALLGLGAKERPAEEIPVLPGKKGHLKQDKRYVPLVKVQKEVRSILAITYHMHSYVLICTGIISCQEKVTIAVSRKV